MNPEGKFFFAHPSLISDNFIQAENDHYALVTYPHEAVTHATVILLNSFIQTNAIPENNSKRRIKFLLEFYGVALSLPINNVNIMKFVVGEYKKWLESDDLFGSQERKNRYYRRIFEQLSLPFNFTEIIEIDLFKSSYYQMLMDILEILNNFKSEYGRNFEPLTWRVLFKVLIIITNCILNFDFTKCLPKEMISRISQLSVRVLYSVVFTCGIFDNDFWEIFYKYSQSWSKYLDFLYVWGSYTHFLFSLINNRIYHLNEEIEFLNSGVYHPSNAPIKTEEISILFYHLIKSFDYHQTLISNINLNEFNKTLYNLVNEAKNISKKCSSFLLKKYPAKSFLKLFGPMLSFANIQDSSFNKAVSYNVQAIFEIFSNFDHHDAEPILIKLFLYAMSRVDLTRPQIFEIFINSAPELFRFSIAKRIADFTINNFPSFKAIDTSSKPPNCDSTHCLMKSFVSLFISASEELTVHIVPEDKVDELKSKIEKSFEKTWSICSESELHYALLCNCVFKFNMIQKIAEIFSDKIELGSPLRNYAEAAITFLGAAIRHNSQLSYEMKNIHIFPTLVTLINSFESPEKLLQALLSLSSDLLFYSKELFLEPGNVNSLLTLLNAAKQKQISSDLIEYVEAHINIHTGCFDFQSGRYGSSSEVNEENIINQFGQDTSVHYYTIGESILVSFIENKDHDKMAIFARGPFGKSSWNVKDDYLSQREYPKFSLEFNIQPTTTETFSISPLELNGEINSELKLPSITIQDLEKYDDDLRQVFQSDFSNWSEFRYSEPFSNFENGHIDYKRTRIVDFLTTLGLVDGKNSMHVRAYTTQEEILAVKDAITKFDRLDDMPIRPILVTPILGTDKSLADVPNNRMTTLLKQFMNEIAEPMTFNEYADFPNLASSVPVLNLGRSMGAIVTPAMGKDEGDRQQIADFSKSCALHIIFNETPFRLVNINEFTSPNVLIISPLGNHLYNVILHKSCDSIMPFLYEQTLSIKVLAFDIAVTMQKMDDKLQLPGIETVVKRRKEVIGSLCTKAIDEELGPLLSEKYS